MEYLMESGCLWELLHSKSSPTTMVVNYSYMNNMTLLNNVEFVGT